MREQHNGHTAQRPSAGKAHATAGSASSLSRAAVAAAAGSPSGSHGGKNGGKGGTGGGGSGGGGKVAELARAAVAGAWKHWFLVGTALSIVASQAYPWLGSDNGPLRPQVRMT